MQKKTPDAFAEDVIDGLLAAHPDQLRTVGDDRRALVHSSAGTMGRVGIVTGGGLGHLPLFPGYVGHGLASGAAIGNVMCAPGPQQILAATLASDDGAGVLYLYRDNAEDTRSFDAAASLAADQGIRVATVLSSDDISSASATRGSDVGGVGALVLAYKTAGAAAERGSTLDEVARIASATIEQTRTIRLEPGADPERPLGQWLDEFPSDIDVVALINGLGSVPLEDLYQRHAHTIKALDARGVRIHRSCVGEYATSAMTSGIQVSLLTLDDELCHLVDAPARSPFFGPGTLFNQGIMPVAHTAPALTRRTAERPVSRRPLPAGHPHVAAPDLRDPRTPDR